jgi:hypothetical protein
MNLKVYIKIYIKTAPTCFGAFTPSSGSVLFVLALESTSNNTCNYICSNFVQLFAYIADCMKLKVNFFYSPTDAQVNCLKNNLKVHIKIYIKTAPTCFGTFTPLSGSALLVLAKESTSSTLPDNGVNAPKHVGAVLM